MDAGPDSGLIFDIGMSEGNDTAFYLAKGFRVLGVEADPATFAQVTSRFAAEIAAGTLRVLNRAAAASGADVVSFFANEAAQGHSRMLQPGEAVPRRPGRVVEVPTVDWATLVGMAGTPHYAKVDIEGAELPFLRSMLAVPARPTYLSAECHTVKPIQAMIELGYRRFRLVNQTILHTFKAPDPPLEGRLVPGHKFVHASGFFGRELPGREWLDAEGVLRLFATIEELRGHGTIFGNIWFDCHAWTGA